MRGARDRAEVLLNEIDQLLMIDIAGAYHYHVLAKVVALVEVDDHFAVDLSNVVDVAEDRLTHHVISEDIEVDVLHESLFRVLVCRL